MNGVGMDELLTTAMTSLNAQGLVVATSSEEVLTPGLREAVLRLTRGGAAQEYAAVYGPAVRPEDVGLIGRPGLPRMVVTRFVGVRTAETLRRAGVQYIDSVGNAWIEFGDVYIDVRGRRRPKGQTADPRPAGNLFSASRAQVIFVLLAWPSLWGASQRKVAEAAGVSLGQAHNTLRLLAEAGYHGERARPGQVELLELWAAAYATGLAKRITLATYRGEIDRVEKAGLKDAVFVSGEQAAWDVLRPTTLTLYVETLDPRLAVMNRWRSDGPPNIIVRRKFWHAPDGSDEPVTGMRDAPWPLVYADLLGSDDPRVRSVAREPRERFARPE